MKRMLYFELLKLKQWKVLWSVLLGLLVINLIYIGFAVNRIGEDNSRMVEKYEIYQELENMPKEEAIAFLEKKMEDCRLLYEEDWGNPYNRYSQYRTVRENMAFAYSHEEWMELTKEQSLRFHNPLFQSGDGNYQIAHAKQTLEVYEKLGYIKTKFVYEEPFQFVLENPVLEISVFVSVFVLIVQLIIYEREKGYLQYIKIAKNGKYAFLTIKCLVVAVFIIGIVLLFYGSSILLLSYFMPYDGTLPLQCLQSFVGCPFPISIYEGMSIFVLDRCFVYLLFGAMILAISNYLNAILKIVMGCLAVFGGQWLIWKIVSPFSNIYLLHTINLFSITDSKMLLSSYDTWNIWDIPINQILCVWLLRILLFIGILYVTFYTFINKKEGEYEKSETLLYRYQKYVNRIEHIHRKSGVFTIKSGEAYKLLIRNGGIAVFLVSISICLLFVSEFRVFTDSYRYYMQEYGTILEGIPNEEKTRWLEEQNAYWEIQERALEEQEELVQTGELSQEAYQMQIKIYENGEVRRRALEDVGIIYDRAVRLNEAGQQVEFTLQEVWEFLFGIYGIGNFVQLLCIVVVALILVLSNCGVEEHTTGMQTLLQVYKYGKKVKNIKKIYAFCYALILNLCIFGIYYGKILIMYEVHISGLHTKSIYLLADFLNMPVVVFCILLVVVLTIVMFIVTRWIIYLSYQLKNRIFAIFTSVATLIFPIVVVYLLIS